MGITVLNKHDLLEEESEPQDLARKAKDNTFDKLHLDRIMLLGVVFA